MLSALTGPDAGGWRVIAEAGREDAADADADADADGGRADVGRETDAEVGLDG
jgi:hypothetical protein